MKLLLLIASIIVFTVGAILTFVDPTFTVIRAFSVDFIGLGLLAGFFLPIP